MTEQVRTISRDRVVDRAGRVAPETLDVVRRWIRDFLDL
jgi:mRNA interferase MazF